MSRIKNIPIQRIYYSLFRNNRKNSIRNYCSVASDASASKGGFAQAYEKHSKALDGNPPIEPNQSFAGLLRNSKFIDLGDPQGKIVTGTIYHIVEDDLYIDFGWKFHCVCQRPNRNGDDYVRGSKVRLRIKELELSTKFLGNKKDLTILEADCQLLGLIYSPARTKRTEAISE